MKNLGDESLAILVAVAQQLQLLGVQEPGRVSDQGFALLAGLPNLKTLWVDCCKLSMPVLMALACYPSLCLLEVHQSHPEADTLGFKQLELLGRVKGPKLSVVIREGARSKEEVLRPQLTHGVQHGARDASDASEGVAGIVASSADASAVGFGGQELVLEHGLMVGGGQAHISLLAGQGGWQTGLAGALGLLDDDLHWPAIGGLQV